jgi:hypothetical protein
MAAVAMLAAEQVLPTGSPPLFKAGSSRSASPRSTSRLTLELEKSSKGRCGATFIQQKSSLQVGSVTSGSLAEECGLCVGDVIISVDTIRDGTLSVKEDLRFSKHKFNAILFDLRGTCYISVLRGKAKNAMEVDNAACGRALHKPISDATLATTAASADAQHTRRQQQQLKQQREEGGATRSVADARAAAEARVAAAMAEASKKAKVKAAEKAAAEMRAAEEVRKVAEAKAAAVAKAAEDAAARRREALEKKEAADRAAAAAAAALAAETMKPGAGSSRSSRSLRSSRAPSVFDVGAKVLYENERTGVVVEATVTAVNASSVPMTYTIACGFHERETVAERLTLNTGGSTSSRKRGTDALAGQPPARKPRLGRGNPKIACVPNLMLAERGIGANAQSIASKNPFGSVAYA